MLNISVYTRAERVDCVNNDSYSKYFSISENEPIWVRGIVKMFRDHENDIDTTAGKHKKSDEVLGILAPDLIAMGYEVEESKSRKIPVGLPYLNRKKNFFEIDALNRGAHIGVEIEASRAQGGGAAFRNIIRLSMAMEIDYAVFAVPKEYRYGKTKEKPYDYIRDYLQAIYAGARLQLPLKGVLLVGY